MKKILVIDDSEVNLFLIQTIFENDPEVLVAIESNSRKAIRHLENDLPDVLILDLMMPHVDGFEVLKKIRSNPDFKDLPVLVISARYDDESIQRVKKHGVLDFIVKPINLLDIEEKIRKYLNQTKVIQ